MLSFMNMFFHIEGLKILAMKLTVQTFMIKLFFTEDQPILNKPSQVIFTPCDNIENNVNDDHESHIQISKEVCSHRDQTLNENHETTQSIRMSTRPKILPEYLKDYHCNLNVSNTSLS